jgi:hypothetical protein
MRERILKVSAKLGRKMSDGIVAEPGAPERHRALGIADAYKILQDEFPEIFSEEAPEKPISKKEIAEIAVAAVGLAVQTSGDRGKGFATSIDKGGEDLVISPALGAPQEEAHKGEQYNQQRNHDAPDQGARPSQDSSSSHPEEPPRDSESSEPND